MIAVIIGNALVEEYERAHLFFETRDYNFAARPPATRRLTRTCLVLP
ncbi:hypothetical protein [Streptomyces sp. NPDC000880]